VSNAEIVAGQLQALLELYPKGAKAIELLVSGRNLAERWPGVTFDELRKHIAAVDYVLGPLERVEIPEPEKCKCGLVAPPPGVRCTSCGAMAI
jgi:hypothetical protein